MADLTTRSQAILAHAQWAERSPPGCVGFVSGSLNDGLRRRRLTALMAHAALAKLDRVPAAGHRWRMHSLRTGPDVMALRCSDGAGLDVCIRFAWSPLGEAALRAEREAAAVIAGKPALLHLSSVVPTTHAHGEIAGHAYACETSMNGIDGRRLRPAERTRAVQTLATTIAPLYEHTAVCAGDPRALMCELVNELVGTVQAVVDAAARAHLARVSVHVKRALAEREPRLVRVHGDLALGNALFTPDGATVTGLVDWSASRASALADVDISYLLITSRALADNNAVGSVVAALIDGGDAIDDFGRELRALYPASVGSVSALVLLAWLQHAALVLGDSKLWLARRWVRHNVDPVLAAFCRSINRDSRLCA